MQMATNRKELEQAILGACLLENGYDKVAGVLSHKNFTAGATNNHQVIFKALEDMYPGQAIDLRTVARKLDQPFISSYLAFCSSQVSSAANLRAHAFVLLQICLEDALIELLAKASQKSSSTVTRAGIQEIIEECRHSSSDILSIYEKVPGYLDSLGAEAWLIDEIQKLCSSSFNEKMHKIRQRAHIDALFQNLENLRKGTMDNKSRLCLGHLAQLYKDVLAMERITPEAMERILLLRL